MFSFRYLLFFTNILLILISLTKAVSLDIACTNNTACGAPGAICQGGKCQCDTPWYTPCNTTICNLQPAFVYQGNECRDTVNCLPNAACISQRCTCSANYTAINGLCYKSLNSSCVNPSECWSRECRGGSCQCPLGFEPKGDNSRCQLKLANLYVNWTSANASGDFCYSGSDFNNCRDPNAICQSVAPNTDKFCQCPSPYSADYTNQECQLNVCNGALSPSITPIPYEDCGTCKYDNAIYIPVANQSTCWCQSGFINNNGNCEKSSTIFIFPDSNDINQHQYALPSCSSNTDNGTSITGPVLCACAPGYTFVNKTSPCQLITPIWVNDNFEYGVCTRINSNGQPVAENGSCPSPLTCQARQDKYVCSCGPDRYLDGDSNTCYYFLNRNLTSPNATNCPLGSTLVGSTCQCSPSYIYVTSNDTKRCELKLSPNQSGSQCTIDDTTNNTYCVNLFGGNTRFCGTGECRCISGSSFNQNGRCVTLIYGNPGNKSFCPANAQNIGNECLCNPGYQSAPDNSSCICNNDNSTFSISTYCLSYLDTALPTPNAPCPTNANFDTGTNTCQCKPGYKNSVNTFCVPLTSTVYRHNDTTGVNISDITSLACRNLFGYAAEATQDDGYCQCSNESVAFWNNNACYYLVGQQDLSGKSCAPGSRADDSNICICPPGYQADLSGGQRCDPKTFYPLTLQSINIITLTTPCNASYTDGDCQGLYGAGAVCRNFTCYCDQALSLVRNNQCELFSKYVFPGSHERSSMTCNSQDDCGVNSVQNGIECNYIQGYETNYKVCKCQSGYFLNPFDSACVKGRCQTQCSDNEECQGYQCVCKAGYYQDSTQQCVPVPTALTLHDTCNVTIQYSNEQLECLSSCGRVQCRSNYRDDGSQCVKYTFDDYCFLNPSLCSQFSSYATCDTDENKCDCFPGYYRTQSGAICARAVNGNCTIDLDCGDVGLCLTNKCQCKPGLKEAQVLDILGRKITSCINGVDQIRFSPVLLLLFVFVRMIFA